MTKITIQSTCLVLLCQLLSNSFAQEPAARGSLTLRVLSYNIHHCEGVDRKLDVERIAGVIQGCNPDLVALQEVDRGVRRSQAIDQPAMLAKLLGMHVVFEKNIEFDGGQYGNAVLSRLPIQRRENHALPTSDGGEQRGVLDLDLETALGTIRILATHLDHRRDNRERKASIEFINKLVAGRESTPTILAGDLNAPFGGEILQQCASIWTATNTEAMPTIPVDGPNRQIDFVLTRPLERWRAVETRVLDERVASDHRPILAVVELLPPSVAVKPNRTSTNEQAKIRDSHGIFVHEINSSYQAGVNELRVLVPDEYPSGKPNRFLFVLPVEARNGEKWGDGLREVKRLDLHNRFDLICVAPSFSQLPWYANHPSDQTVQQESYLLKSVLPLLEQTYSHARNDRDGRLLVGFSKSGYGAWSLLLRHPDVFGRAAAWDAPLGMNGPGKYGSGPIYGTEENFREYEISKLLRERKELLQQSGTTELGPRLIHAGYGNFREEHEKAEGLLNELDIVHIYRDGPQRQHHWSSGWLEELVALLAEQSLE